MVFEFFVWWYGRGWLEAWRTARNWVMKVEMEFSTLVLLQTLFAPWKQIITFPGRSIGEKFQAMLDNLVSRVIGFWVRFFVLLIAAMLIAITAIAGLALAIAWPFVPLASAYCFYRSLTG